jgi:DNA-binding beta-propeller fold protein YncE
MLTPIDDPSAFYSIRFNPVTDELYVTTFGRSTVFVYAIPTPGATALLALAGLAISRRRRA